MWNPPSALSPEAQNIVARTRKRRKFFVFLRERRHALLDADFPHTVVQRSSSDPGGPAPVEAGLLALATLLQAYCHVGARDAVARTGMDTRWQLGRDGLGAEQPSFRQGTLYNCRLRLIAHNLDKTLRERTIALAEKPGGFGARQRRAVLDAPPLFGAGRVADTVHLLGHALRKAGGLAAQGLGTAAAAVVEDAGLTLGGPSSLTAALDRDGEEPGAREQALGLVLEEGVRWQRWLAQQQPLAAEQPPLQEVMATSTPILTHDTAPDPGGGPGGRRLTQPVAPDRRLSIEATDMRHGRNSSANTFHGFKAHCAVDVASTVIREVVELLAEALEKTPGLLQLAIDLGDMASPRIAQWAAQGVDIIARPWPQVGPLFTTQECILDCAGRQVTWPGGQTVPMVPGTSAQVPATACDVCVLRAPYPTATYGPGRSVSIRVDEPLQQQLRAKRKTRRGRAALRKRTAVEHTSAHPWGHQGRRARYTGLRKNQCDGRRHAAVSNKERHVMRRYSDSLPEIPPS